MILEPDLFDAPDTLPTTISAAMFRFALLCKGYRHQLKKGTSWGPITLHNLWECRWNQWDPIYFLYPPPFLSPIRTGDPGPVFVSGAVLSCRLSTPIGVFVRSNTKVNFLCLLADIDSLQSGGMLERRKGYIVLYIIQVVKLKNKTVLVSFGQVYFVTSCLLQVPQVLFANIYSLRKVVLIMRMDH